MKYYLYFKNNELYGYTQSEDVLINENFKEVSLEEYKVIIKEEFGVSYHTEKEGMNISINDNKLDIEDIAEITSYTLEDSDSTAEMLVYALEKISELEEKIKILEEGVI